ncbi:hypothetical protein [Streptomyces sp. NPDC002403]
MGRTVFGGRQCLLTAHQWAQLYSLRLAPRDVCDCFFLSLLEVAEDELR